VLARMEREGFKHAREASRETLIPDYSPSGNYLASACI